MIRKSGFLAILFIYSCNAQAPIRQENQFELWKLSMSTEAQDQLRARKVEAFLRERDFVDQLNRLAEVWTKFVNEYNQKHAINVKLARDLSKAFRDVEKENGWPNVRVKNRKFVFLHKAAEPDHSCE